MKVTWFAVLSLVSRVALAQEDPFGEPTAPPVVPPAVVSPVVAPPPMICFPLPYCALLVAPAPQSFQPPPSRAPVPVVVVAVRPDRVRTLFKVGAGIFGGFHAPFLTAGLSVPGTATIGIVPILGPIVLAILWSAGSMSPLFVLDAVAQSVGIGLLIAGAVRHARRGRVHVAPLVSHTTAGVGVSVAF